MQKAMNSTNVLRLKMFMLVMTENGMREGCRIRGFIKRQYALKHGVSMSKSVPTFSNL